MDELRVDINVSGLEQETTSKQVLDQTTSKQGEELAKTKEKKALNDTAKGITGAAIFSFAKSSVNTIVESRLSSVGTRYGDEALQNRINNISNVVKQTTSAAIGVAAGGVAGGPAGAAIAIAVELVSKGTEIINNKLDYMRDRLEEQREITRKANRLGVVAAGAGRRNW